MHIRKVASPGPTDKMSVSMDRHRLAYPQPHGDAVPMTPAGGYRGPRWGYPGPLHRLQIISGCYPVYRICTYIHSVYYDVVPFVADTVVLLATYALYLHDTICNS